MKRLTFDQFTAFCEECPGMPGTLGFQDFKQITKMTKYYLKVQSFFTAEEDFITGIKHLSAWDAKKNEVRNFIITARTPLTFEQWIKLQIADSFFCTKAEIKEFVNI